MYPNYTPMMKNNNNFADYTVTLAGLMDDRVKYVNNIRKGIDLAKNISCLLQLKDTLLYIQRCIFWKCLSQGYCSESNQSTLQQINEEIGNCNSELNNQIHKAVTDKIIEEFTEFAKRQLDKGYL